MPKIPESEIERIKNDIDLVALIAASGVQLKKQGSNWIGLCPFHNDKDPSLIVTGYGKPKLVYYLTIIIVSFVK